MSIKVVSLNVALLCLLFLLIPACDVSAFTVSEMIDMHTFVTIDDVQISADDHNTEYIRLGNTPELSSISYYYQPSAPTIDDPLAYVALNYEQEMQTAAESSAIEKTYAQSYTFMANNPLYSGTGLNFEQGSNSISFAYDFDSNGAFLSVVLYDPVGLSLFAYKIITESGEGTVNLGLPSLESLAGPIAMDFRVENYLLFSTSQTIDSFVVVEIGNLQIIRELNHTPDPVPEPSTILLLGSGLLGLGWYWRKRTKA